MPSTSFGYYKPFQLGKGKKELTAKAATFDLSPKPARDQLVNFLIRFHETECPLREVEPGFPAG